MARPPWPRVNWPATVAQQPALIGAIGVETADKVLKGQPVEKSIPVPLQVVSK